MNTQNTQATTIKQVVPNQNNLQGQSTAPIKENTTEFAPEPVKEDLRKIITVSEKVYIRRKERPEEKYRYDSKVDVDDIMSDHLKFIGSTFGAGSGPLRGLNPEEESKLLPILLGSNPIALNWEEVKKEYWCNIRKLIPSGIGLELEIGMTYKSKKDYDSVINFTSENSKNIVLCEQFKLSLGTPIKVEDYVIYRFCLVHGKVANTFDDINKSNKIQFYIYSKAKEVSDQFKEVGIRRKAYDSYLRILSNPETCAHILLMFDLEPDKLSPEEQEIELDRLARTQPNAFLAHVNSKNLDMKGLIERAIRKQKLYRLPNTDAIYYGDQLLGETLEKAASYLSETRQSKLLMTLRSEMTHIVA